MTGLNARQTKALELASRGLLVVPAYSPKAGATRKSHPADQGKLPIGKEWEQSRRLQDAEIVQAWAGSTPYNISVLTGTPSGVFVWDIDGEAGFATMGQLVAQHGQLPPTYTVRTGSGGYHYYYLMPADFEVRNKQKLLPGIDIRGTGGQVVAATSANTEGTYDEAAVLPFAPAPAWMLELLRPAQRVAAAPLVPAAQVVRDERTTKYEDTIVEGELQRLRDLAQPWQPGAGWDLVTYEVACVLTQVANSPWSTLTHDTVEALLHEYGPHDESWGDAQIREKLVSARRSVGDKVRSGPAPRVDDSGMFARAQTSSTTTEFGPGPGRVITTDREVDVTSKALAAAWLRNEVGGGHLAGIFYRKGELVYTPQIGEKGYIELKDWRANNAASVTVMNDRDLQARIQHRYEVIAMTEDKKATAAALKTLLAANPEADPGDAEVWKPKPAIFPLEAATIITHAADDAPYLRELRGVVHAPTFRADGSLITMPGYDEETGLLFLPTGGQPAAVPETPSQQEVATARSWLDLMLADFRFVTEHDRASYLGLLMTPLLRAMIPPPYKLGVIEAHQPGSGKSFLARAIMTVYGGVEHTEIPPDEAELAKVIGSILDTQTSPVVIFDNVTGLVKSPTLAGLLTSPTFQGRRLGSSTVIEANNDRLWLMTANNAALGGDLGRRNVRVRIDPGVPSPEKRTEFQISDFEAWVRARRPELLWSLLVLVRHWVCQGMPFVDAPAKDSYGRWVATVRGILATAGVPGSFDAPETQAESMDPEADEWRIFLEAIASSMDDRTWTAKSLLALVSHPNFVGDDPAKPLPFDILPSSLLAGKYSVEPASLAKSLGKFIGYRKGRWFGDLSVQSAGSDPKKGNSWRIVRYTR